MYLSQYLFMLNKILSESESEFVCYKHEKCAGYDKGNFAKINIQFHQLITS